MEKKETLRFINKTDKFLEDFFSSDLFIWVYTVLVYLMSLTTRGEITVSVVMLTCSFIFFTQKSLIGLLPPFVLSYFAFPFLTGTFSDSPIIYVSFTVLLASIIFFIVKNKAKLLFSRNLIALLPYALAYVLGGIFTATFISQKGYVQNLGLLVILTFAFCLMALITGNLKKITPNYVFKIIFAMGVLITVQIITKALIDTEFSTALKQDSIKLNWGIYNGIITVILFSVPACFYFVVKNPKRTFIYVTVAIIEVFSSFLSGSRAAIFFLPLYLIAVMIFTCFFIGKKERWLLINTFLTLLIVAVLILTILYSFEVPFIKNIFSSLAQDGFSGSGRFEIWQRSWDYFINQPAFGQGFMHNSDEKIGLTGGFWLSHNTILQALSSLGLFGIITLFIHLFTKYATFTKKNLFSLFALVMFIGTEAYGLIDCLIPAPYYAMPMLMLVMCADVIQKDKNELPLINRKYLVKSFSK